MNLIIKSINKHKSGFVISGQAINKQTITNYKVQLEFAGNEEKFVWTLVSHHSPLKVSWVEDTAQQLSICLACKKP